ncbi:MAG: DUF4859 domain-containing protein [Tannerellaceae bacterium]|nr:DUF4859 domain-containing protein [Tannerellaceae bacterium]
MKKSTILLFLLSLVMMQVISCSDDEVSTKHIYTDEELAYIDSLEQARNKLNADYVFEYQVNLPIDENYASTPVKVDATLLCEKLGFASLTDLVDAMYEGSLVFFAIDGSTKYDNKGDYTASGYGHWFDAEGNVTTWGSGVATLFSELDEDTFTFYIGHYPNMVEGEDKYRIIQALEKNDGYRIAFDFNIIIGDAEEYIDPETPPTGEPYAIEKNYEVTLSSEEYDGEDIDVKEILRDAFKMTTYQIYEAIKAGELVLKGLNADGSVYLTDEGEVGYTANYPGHWFNVLGDVCTWGSEGFAYFSELHASEDELVLYAGIGDSSSDGDEYHFTQVAELNGGQVTFHVTIKIVD